MKNYHQYTKSSINTEFKKEIKEIIKYNTELQKYNNTDLYNFLNSVLPVDSNQFFIYADDFSSGEKRFCNIGVSGKEKYINSLCALAEEKYNLYYSPVSYSTWRTNDNALKFGCLYVDIDNVPFDISILSKEELKNKIESFYNLKEQEVKININYIVKSGHGLHLYLLVDSNSDFEKREKALKGLNYIFGGDISCIPISHIIRVPLSLNCKNPEDIKKSELFYYSDEVNSLNDLSELGYLYISEFEEYKIKCNKETADKRKATMIKNGTFRTRKSAVKKVAKNKVVKEKPKKEKQVKEKDILKYSDINFSDFEKDNSALFVTQADIIISWNRINDIKAVINKYGFNEGSRNNIVFVLANLLRKSGNEIEETTKYIFSLINPDFNKEAFTIIKNTYENLEPYTFTNKYIASLLGWGADITASLKCNYSDIEKEEYKKSKQIRSNKKESQINKELLFISRKRKTNNKELANILNYSIRTIQRRLVLIREFNKTIKAIRKRFKTNNRFRSYNKVKKNKLIIIYISLEFCRRFDERGAPFT